MLNKCLKSLMLGLVCLPLLSVAAEPEFHYEASLSEANGTYRRAELPWFVLANLLQANQADLQVRNADNQVLPSRVSPIGDLQLQPEERSLNFFRGDDPRQVGVLLQLEPTTHKPKLEQLALTDRPYLIIQNSEVAGQLFNLQSLNLSWDSQQLSQWLPKNLKVETSDNLQTWQPVSTKRLPYILKEQAVLVENRRLEFDQPIKSRFLRLSGDNDFAPLLSALQSVSGLAPEQAMQRIAWQAVSLTSTADPQQFTYQMPPSLPVKYWRMRLDQPGDLYAGQLQSRYPDARYGANAKYDTAVSFLDYRLSSELGELRAPSQSLPSPYAWYGDHSIEWLWTFTQPKPLSASKVVVEFAWQPLEIRFIAQGKGPFRLVYGSRDRVEAVTLPFDDTDVLAAQRFGLTSVEVSTEQVLKPLEQPVSYRQWLPYMLWVVLMAAVILLLWMARNLWRDLNKTA
ncbi:DUF3999 family protein [uncultured Thiothrix sp.]|uniref:DUF3999 family protein n=1 Tax=uncultured Thiothrix sp. TaxID=223185 RepID=UPI002639E84D|nr:DUF3999 family protein [uncultured Thiothrix sp.]HMT92753.1 DUF3999 family protein [Thiolinea sp.]